MLSVKDNNVHNTYVIHNAHELKLVAIDFTDLYFYQLLSFKRLRHQSLVQFCLFPNKS